MFNFLQKTGEVHLWNVRRLRKDDLVKEWDDLVRGKDAQVNRKDGQAKPIVKEGYPLLEGQLTYGDVWLS